MIVVKVDICWERADLGFPLVQFDFMLFWLLGSFPAWCLGKEVEFGSWSLPLIYFMNRLIVVCHRSLNRRVDEIWFDETTL